MPVNADVLFNFRGLFNAAPILMGHASKQDRVILIQCNNPGAEAVERNGVDATVRRGNLADGLAKALQQACGWNFNFCALERGGYGDMLNMLNAAIFTECRFN